MHLQDVKYDSIDQLKKACKTAPDFIEKITRKNTRHENLKKLRMAGDTALRNGDQELAYMKYVQYLEALGFIQKHETDQKFFKAMYSSDFNEILNKTERINEELISRYEIKQKAQLREKEAKLRLNTPAPPVPREVSVPKPEKPLKDGQTSVGPQQLLKLMREPLLLVDVRPSEEFRQSHIVHDEIVNIPPIILQKAKTANLIGNELPEPAKSLWARRSQFKFIVLLDRDSDERKLHRGLPLYDALISINEWDINTKYENKAVILNGGYEDWLNVYPTLVTNPRALFPSRDVSLMNLDTIQYPTDDLDEPKPVVTPSQPAAITPKPTPAIPDRNKKPVTSEVKPTPPAVPPSHPGNPPTVEVVVEPLSEDKSQDRRDEPSESKPKHQQPTIKSEDESLISKTQENLRINGHPEPSKDFSNMNGGEGQTQTRFHQLKPDGYSEITPTHSGMKRSVSMPKINQVSEEGAGAAPTPSFDRSSKPQPQKSADYYKFLDLRDSDPVHGKTIPGLTGLKNLRNTCYMNSILQCLSNTQALTTFFRNTKDFEKNCESKTEGTIAEEFRTVIFKLWAGEYKSFACKNLKNQIGHYRNTFSGYDQQDSHEFLTILIDWLHEDLKTAPPPCILTGASEESGERAWAEFKKNNYSPIQELFYGQQRSVVTCTNCNERSITFEPFSNLSLPLPSDTDKCTLNECLDLYVQEERISGWECPKCKASRKAVKKLDITRLPPILVIHFKRFTSDGMCRKQLTYVDFPVRETLDMSDFLFGAEHRNILFSLYAVSNHYGTMDGGHYTAYCKGAKTKKWYKYDDQEVCEISPESVKTRAAYIVFYSRIDLANT